MGIKKQQNIALQLILSTIHKMDSDACTFSSIIAFASSFVRWLYIIKPMENQTIQ
jgi:hypothetical protein